MVWVLRQDSLEVRRGVLALSKSKARQRSSQQSLEAARIAREGVLRVCERDVVLSDLESRHGSVAMVDGLRGAESDGLGEGVKRL